MARKNLTRASVESFTYDLGRWADRAKPAPKQILWDAKVRGFGVRCTPEGTKSYVFLYRLNGKQKLKALGRVEDFKNLDDARTAAEKDRALVNQKIDPLAERERMADAQTMTALWDVYEADHLARLSANSRRAIVSLWKLHLGPTVGRLTPAQIAKADVIRVHDVASTKGKIVANRTVQRLRAMLTWLFDRNPKQFPAGWRNPAERTKVLHKERPRREILDFMQQQQLVAALADEPDPFVKAYLVLLLLTGLRSNELMRLKWSGVNYARSLALIGDRKNGEDLIVTLAPVAIELLRSLPVVAGSEYVFPSPQNNGKPLTTNMVRVRYNAALERAGLPHKTLHDLRRSYGTNIARDGGTTRQIASMLGNTEEITARVYVQLAADDLRRLSDANASKLLPVPQS